MTPPVSAPLPPCYNGIRARCMAPHDQPLHPAPTRGVRPGGCAPGGGEQGNGTRTDMDATRTAPPRALRGGTLCFMLLRLRAPRPARTVELRTSWHGAVRPAAAPTPGRSVGSSTPGHANVMVAGHNAASKASAPLHHRTHVAGHGPQDQERKHWFDRNLSDHIVSPSLYRSYCTLMHGPGSKDKQQTSELGRCDI